MYDSTSGMTLNSADYHHLPWIIVMVSLSGTEGYVNISSSFDLVHTKSLSEFQKVKNFLY